MKLWVDDIRNPADHVGEGWTWAQTVAEALDLLATRDVVALSLDYDLERGGYGCPGCVAAVPCPLHETGADVVAYLAAHPERRPREVRLHSANAAGVARMRRELAALGIAATVGGRRT